ncbi:MAG: restriction endonuclease subunit S [Verrucomicrobiales bacterium]|nr:restriction endonuclease subunit S [Verrucomicrobiales bacterium]
MSEAELAASQAWTSTSVGSLGTWSGGLTPSKNYTRFWKDGDVVWLSPKDVRGSSLVGSEDRITSEALQRTALKLYPRNSVLIVVRSGILRHRFPIARCSVDFTVNQDLKVLTPVSGIDSSFCFYALQNIEGLVLRKAVKAGTTVESVDLVSLTRIPIAIPPLPTQRRIAAVLRTVDEVIEATEARIEKQKAIKQGLLHDLFTRGVTPDGQLRPPPSERPDLYRESELGVIPREWEVSLLDNLTTRGSGHTPSRSRPEYWGGGIKWVSLADSWRLDRLYISETDKEISELGVANSSAVLHPPGIVVLSRDAGVGKSAITTIPMAVSQHFMCWICGSKLDRYYLYYLLQKQKREFENIATGTTIPTIGLRFFQRYKIAAPTGIEEQKTIGETLRTLDVRLFELEAKLEKLRHLKSALMQDLLTGRVSADSIDLDSLPA